MAATIDNYIREETDFIKIVKLETKNKQLRRALKGLLKWMPDEEEHTNKPDCDYSVGYVINWWEVNLAIKYAEKVLKEKK